MKFQRDYFKTKLSTLNLVVRQSLKINKRKSDLCDGPERFQNITKKYFFLVKIYLTVTN